MGTATISDTIMHAITCDRCGVSSATDAGWWPTWDGAAAHARKHGWKVGADGSASCPGCSDGGVGRAVPHGLDLRVGWDDGVPVMEWEDGTMHCRTVLPEGFADRMTPLLRDLLDGRSMVARALFDGVEFLVTARGDGWYWFGVTGGQHVAGRVSGAVLEGLVGGLKDAEDGVAL